MTTPKPNGKVHPVTEMFPMLPDDELDELAADMKANGQLHPIVLDKDGTLIDGRNRQEAGKRAGIKLTYEVLNGQDPVAFILSSNDKRRHMSKGQRAMIAAKTCLIIKQPQRTIAKATGLNAGYVAQASIVLEYAKELSDAVIAGNTPLNDAYKIAQERKETAQSDDTKMKKLRKDAADLADQVSEERLTLSEAMGALSAREKEEQRKAEVARQEREIKARHLFIILGSLALGKQSPADIAADLLDYDEETLQGTQLSLTKPLWEKAVQTLQECAKQWEAR